MTQRHNTPGSVEPRLAVDADSRLAVVGEIARALSANLPPETLLRLILAHVTRALAAERATLFLVDDDHDLVFSTHAHAHSQAPATSGADDGPVGIENMRMKRGQGIAGWVAQTGRSVNVKDAYLDSRFDPQWDQRLGYRTRSMLCQPVFDRDGVLIAVVQVLNRQTGWFSVDDEMLLSTIMSMAAIAMVNARLNASLLHNVLELREIKDQLDERLAEIDLLFALEREVGDTSDLDAAIDAIIQRIAATVPSSLCEIALATPNGGLMVHRQERRQPGVQILALPTQEGLCGLAMERRAPVDVAAEAKLVPAWTTLAQLPFAPAAGLVVPLQADDQMLGALVVVDRPGKAGLSDADEKVVLLLSGQVARTLAARQQRAQAEREDRLAALGKALAGVLHDFRTPMTIASGYVQLLIREDEAEERAALAQKTLGQLDALTQMTRDVLAFARGEQVLLTRKVSLQDFAREVEEQLPLVFSGTAVQWHVHAEDRGLARLDPFKILRAIQNIAKNAREALAEHPGARFDVTIAGDADHVVLTFADNGDGVPLSFQHRLFDAFATQGKADGTGLGLAMVRQVAEAHGGDVVYRDTPGGGATFEMTIRRETRSATGQDRQTAPVSTISEVK